MWFRPSERNTLRSRENGVVLPQPNLARVSLSLFSNPREVTSSRAFYSSSSGSYNEYQNPTGGLGTGKALRGRALVARSRI
jgi:hypothetical protein